MPFMIMNALIHLKGSFFRARIRPFFVFLFEHNELTHATFFQVLNSLLFRPGFKCWGETKEQLQQNGVLRNQKRFQTLGKQEMDSSSSQGRGARNDVKTMFYLNGEDFAFVTFMTLLGGTTCFQSFIGLCHFGCFLVRL